MKIKYSAKTIFFILLVYSFVCETYSQIKSFEIEPVSSGMSISLNFNREPFKLVSENGKNVAEYSSYINEALPGSPILPSKTIFIAIPPESKINVQLKGKNENYIPNVQVKVNPIVKAGQNENILYVDSEPDLKYFQTDRYPVSDFEIEGYTWIRDYYCAVVKINTHFYNWKKREITELFSADLSINFTEQKLYSINSLPKAVFDEDLKEIIINYEYASEFRSFQPVTLADPSGDWIDYSKEYVKLAIPRDGIYRITFSDLQNYGINVSQVNPQTIKMFHNGNQLPIFINGENDFSFDANDYIEFWMTRNYSIDDYRTVVNFGQRYINYLNPYNDTSFVWLTWDGDSGQRADSINTFVSGLTDTINSGIVNIHLERDIRLWYYDAVAAYTQLPFWDENKIWSWEFLGGSGNRAFNFSATDVVPQTIVKTIARMKSHAGNIPNNTHKYGSSINSGTPQDTIVFNYKETVNFSSEFNSASLNSGNNVFRIFGLPTNADPNQSVIDWVDIDYYRYNRAIGDSIKIIIPDSVQNSLRIIKVENLTSEEFFVYKIFPSLKRVTAYNYSEGNLFFTDTVSGGDRYLVITQNYFKTPELRTKKQFVNLRDANRGADYIIISNKDFIQSVAEYENFVASNYNVRVETVFIDDIYDEFSFGLNEAEAVQRFLKSAYDNWQSPKPSYLNIIGDANYDYKNVVIPALGGIRKNFVPSFGHPVSDSWFVMWDQSNINIPQMYVGRIPATKNEDILFYLQKHESYISRGFDDWNKEFLFFSGGFVQNQTELNQIKQANENVFNNVVKPVPVGGTGTHFYKTADPVSNLGPYTLAEIREKIGRGGLFVSYIGHSGTQTWDNGITETSDLKNIYSDRHPLISDFGCSTGKFAEPDYEAFGELFIVEQPDGQAISYLGNSSLGYLTTSLRFPNLFYTKLLKDTVTSVGRAHWLAKSQQFTQFGFSEVNRVFNYCNLLFGDPIVSFRTPLKPNFAVRENSFWLLSETPNDMTDSIEIAIEILNTGRVPVDSLDVNIKSSLLGALIFETDIKVSSPLFKDTLKIFIPVQKKVGEHTVTVQLDKNNLFDEIYENDNTASFNFYVYSTSTRPIELVKYYTLGRQRLRILNPTIPPQNLPEQILLSLADNPEFISPINTTKNFDTVFTTLNLASLTQDKRFWWRVKINEASQEWSDVFSFVNANKNFSWFIDDSFNAEDLQYSNIKFDSTLAAWTLTTTDNVLEIFSGGTGLDFGSMMYNGQEVLPNTFYWGIGTAEIDTVTLKPSNFRYFLFWDGNAGELMKNYLDSLPMGSVVAMAICADGAQSVLGFSGGTPIRHTIEEFGSLYADSIRYGDSWCLIGRKGAPMGSVPEALTRQGLGPAATDTSNVVNNEEGFIIFPLAGKSSGWTNIEKQDFLTTGTSINYYPLVLKENGDVDTLSALNFINNQASLNHIDFKEYPYLKIMAELKSNEFFDSPNVNSLGINFEMPADLAINYQVVSISADTLDVGDDVRLDFRVFNPTEAAADSFKVLTQLIDNNNSVVMNSEKVVASLGPLSSRSFTEVVNTLYLSRNYTFRITIDPDNRIEEFFEDNNFYSVPFYVRPDTSVPSVNVTFNGNDIFDGDYIPANPEIKIELSDPSLLPITDTSSVTIFLNDEQVYYADNPQTLEYTFNSSNPKVVVKYTPQLLTGEYTLRVFGKNYIGNLADSSGYEKYFIVDEDTKILDVYNYPNPFSTETHFTFRLTQIPDNLKIRIYTVSGRLIREIEKSFSELNHNLNIIPWNGKDQDKDHIANGVYFYKVIMTKDGVSQTVTQKLAKVQ